MVQQAVADLCELVTELNEQTGERELAIAMRLLGSLERPLTKEDVAALIGLLPRNGDTAYGLNWTILHAIESAPDWPIWELLRDDGNEWICRLKLALRNGVSPAY